VQAKDPVQAREESAQLGEVLLYCSDDIDLVKEAPEATREARDLGVSAAHGRGAVGAAQNSGRHQV
jgi:hypothetical protein